MCSNDDVSKFTNKQFKTSGTLNCSGKLQRCINSSHVHEHSVINCMLVLLVIDSTWKFLMNLYISAMHNVSNNPTSLFANVNNTAYICGDNQPCFYPNVCQNVYQRVKNPQTDPCATNMDIVWHRIKLSSQRSSPLIGETDTVFFRRLESENHATFGVSLGGVVAGRFCVVNQDLSSSYFQGQIVSPQQISIINALHHFILRIHFKSQHCIHYLSR